MTKEIRLVFSAEEIIGVRYKCQRNGCTQEFLCRLDDSKSWMPLNCPSCGKTWRVDEGNAGFQILVMLRALVNCKRPESPVIVSLEIECEETD